jgi:subtilisin-like proprotein convertase family protein
MVLYQSQFVLEANLSSKSTISCEFNLQNTCLIKHVQIYIYIERERERELGYGAK